jgi:hypothetical protein
LEKVLLGITQQNVNNIAEDRYLKILRIGYMSTKEELIGVFKNLSVLSVFMYVENC